jgi:threonine dehydrogenase-like Zn-dependent dehydrogenase
MTDAITYAVTITARERAELLTSERSTAPLAAREVAGRTLATLVSAGTELAGHYQAERFPTVPGYASVFEVEAVGSEVTDIDVGDHAFCMGRHQSYQRAPREVALPVPAGLSPAVATFARMMGVSMSTLTTTTARPPQTVLVTGLGLVGHLAAQIFASCGYDVIACDPLASRREFATRVGLRSVLPAPPLDDERIAGHVALVLECSGHEQAALDGCRIVRKRGEVAQIGAPWRRQTDITAHEILHAVFHRYVTLRSGWEWELPRQPTDFRTNSIFENYQAALRWLAEGRVRVDELFTKAPPRDCQRVYQDLLHRRGERLAVVFDWTDVP